MKNSELDSILKKARTPEPSPEFWEEFPHQVIRALDQVPVEKRHHKPSWLRQLAWGLAAGFCILAAFAFGHWRGRMETATASSKGLLENVKLVRETLAMFPNQVRAIVQDQHGLKLVLANQPDVPVSEPIYLRICSGTNCSSVVTFSGQQIQISGKELTVLSDSDGGIILEGDQFLWSSDGKSSVASNFKIEARTLGATL